MTQILGIETSCDETAAAVVADGRWVVSNVVASQHELHRRYLGVVPEIASRAHLEHIGPVIDRALDEAGVGFDRIDAIAVGNRPGLIGSLMVGVAAAKAASWATGKPLIGVNHVHAHLHSAVLAKAQQATTGSPPPVEITYPALGLVVSGGHSNLYHVRSSTRIELLGKTIDDAVGEAYDKAAVILGLGYPGGPAVDRCAQTGDPTTHAFPRSMLDADSLDFSFSGLKTALLYTVRGHPQGRGRKAAFTRDSDQLTDRQRADMAASFQAAAIDALMMKITRCLDVLGRGGSAPTCLLIGGGVSANSLLRTRIGNLGQRVGVPVHIPDFEYCLDNAAMIAGLGFELFRAGHRDDLHLPVVATVMR